MSKKGEEIDFISKQETNKLVKHTSNKTNPFHKMPSNPQIGKPNSDVIAPEKYVEEKNLKKRVSFADENYSRRLAEIQLVESYKDYNAMKQGKCGCSMI